MDNGIDTDNGNCCQYWCDAVTCIYFPIVVAVPMLYTGVGISTIPDTSNIWVVVPDTGIGTNT